MYTDREIQVLQLLKSIMDEAAIYQQDKEDTTRGWCSEMSCYLRGNVGIISILTPEEFQEIQDLLHEYEEMCFNEG